MNTSIVAFFPSAGRAIALALMTLAVVPACGENTVEAPPPTSMSSEERQRLEQHIAELEAEVAEMKAELEKHHQDAAASEQALKEMEAQVSQLTEELAEARALLESQDWDGVLVKLEAARAELASLQARVATLPGHLQLTATLRFGNQPFVLDQPFTLPSGEQISFTELRYWLSNIKLLKQDGTSVALPGSYHLMELIKEQPLPPEFQPTDGRPPVVLPANRREQVRLEFVPAGVYTGIELSVGVDPYYNDNLSRQAGELHLGKNMVDITWNWFTSYIFTKTKGTYVSADNRSGAFAWETGGNSNFRTTKLAFSAPVTLNAQKHVSVSLNADVARLFDTLLPSTTPRIGATSAEGATVSDGFATMFSLSATEISSQW
ncbi:hypothetical protein F0U60_32825 [Archangium minus]|uniref:Copper-binding protein MbnP-like domain-containing protein n=1 Tax=Archangium minus TaxID=83450 RepID=A0ABY9WZ32_9BACT|nr:hypothetical protein F0U60_32825 [Archangium minus]